MILGMSVATFTVVHVVISLIGILSGFVMLARMLGGRGLDIWNTVFLLTTIATSVSGFLFHFTSFGPPEIVGVISLLALAAAVASLYAFDLAGIWRGIYAGAAIFALYLNVFVAVVQTFQKIGFFKHLAPTQTEPPFLIAQFVVLAGFVVMGILAVRRFRPA